MDNDKTSDDIENKLQQHLQKKQDRILHLSRYSHARIDLGHTGGRLKCKDWLEFQSGYAQARDALFADYPLSAIHALCNAQDLEYIEIHSRADDPMKFLLRPDLGGELDPECARNLQLKKQQGKHQQKDLLVVISGGLSPLAIQNQIPHFLPAFVDCIRQQGWSLSPVILNPRGRIALGDCLNAFFNAKLVIMLIGERPGISTPDSMGIYFTWQAKPGCTNDQRNCISNIHEHGLSYSEAVSRTIYLLGEALINRASGIALKDKGDAMLTPMVEASQSVGRDAT